MSLLEQNEQIYIENVDQLINVYRLLKHKWDNNYSLINEIKDFQKGILTYVRRHAQGYPICLGYEDPNYINITYDDFISRIEKPHVSTPTIIESIDGKKYEVIVIDEVKEPMTFHEWCRLESIGSIFFSTKEELNNFVEKYVQYRKSLEQ
jgi:hypothetical protein